MKKIKTFLFTRIKFELTQYYFFRKYIKGTYYLIDIRYVGKGTYWSDEKTNSFQSKVLITERH